MSRTLQDPQIIAAIIGFIGSILGSILGGIVGVLAGAAIERWKSRWRMQDHFIFWIWRMAFDRPAFKDKHADENQDDFNRAIKDTIQAVENGLVMSRKGDLLHQGFGYKSIQNARWKEKMKGVLDSLNEILKFQDDFMKGQGDGNLHVKIDIVRNSVLSSMNELWSKNGIPNLPYVR